MNEDRLPFDRWVEMDLQWFEFDRRSEQIDLLVQRLLPLYRAIEGWRGLIINVGWLIDLVTEWTGQADQLLPLHSRRTAGWQVRTYADLHGFLAQLKQVAAAHGLAEFKVGVLFVNWGHVVWPPDLKIYDFDSDWYDRHPEAYSPPHSFIGMPELAPGRTLHADAYAYARFPRGAREGMPFIDLFAEQWGAVSHFLDVDALVLRDGFMGPMIYTRNGPYGTTASSDPADVRQWTDDVRRLFRSVKAANPNVIVMGYSSGVSAVADWRVGCVDFESVVADGALDAWIDQTWGGAWQDWWHQEWKGWTFQLAYLLLHGVMIAGANHRRATPCRRYSLIETWDAWEPWDTIHQVPGKLRWGIWAFSHASVVDDRGVPHPPNGAYIAWANNRQGELLSAADIAFVQENLDAAQASAARLDRIYGPAAVLHRALLEWLSNLHPDWNASEWIDEQIGFLLKWGIPILSATRSEWLTGAQPEAIVLQTPGQLEDAVRTAMQSAVTQCPALIIGRADVIDPVLLAAAGVQPIGALRAKGFVRGRSEPSSLSSDLPDFHLLHLPAHQPVAGSGTVLFSAESGPILVRQGHVIYWQPPDWSEPSKEFLPRNQVGSLASHVLAARALGEAVASSGHSHLMPPAYAQPVTFHLWRSAGQIHILLGNLETGLTGDARTGRQITLVLNRRQLELGDDPYMLRATGAGEVIAADSSSTELRFLVDVAPEGSAVYILVPVTHALDNL